MTTNTRKTTVKAVVVMVALIMWASLALYVAYTDITAHKTQPEEKTYAMGHSIDTWVYADNNGTIVSYCGLDGK